MNTEVEILVKNKRNRAKTIDNKVLNFWQYVAWNPPDGNKTLKSLIIYQNSLAKENGISRTCLLNVLKRGTADLKTITNLTIRMKARLRKSKKNA